MKTFASALLLTFGLCGPVTAIASPVGTGGTAKQAVRAELKSAYPKTKFGPIQLSQSGIANQLRFTALAKVKIGQFPMQAQGTVSDQVGGWHATLSFAPAAAASQK